jgi:hypothetical protein
MSWAELSFGKYAGMTVSQVLLTDPGWFFWAHGTGVLLKHEIYCGEALARKACRIRIPGNYEDDLIVEYALHPGGGLAAAQIVPAGVREAGGSMSWVLPYIDLSIPSQLAHYDKTGGRIIVNFLKEAYFGSTSYKMTRERCAAFFDDPRNFVQVSVPAAPQR